MKLKDIPDPVWYVAGALLAGALVWQLLKKGASAAGAAINPTNPNNAAYGAVNAVGAALSGDDDFSLGAWLGELVHGDADREAVQGTTAKATVTTTPYGHTGTPNDRTTGQHRGSLTR